MEHGDEDIPVAEGSTRQNEYSKTDLASFLDDLLQGKIHLETSDKLVSLLTAASELLAELKEGGITRPAENTESPINNKGLYHSLQVILSCILKNPQSLASAYASFASSVIEVLQQSSSIEADPTDRRFKDNLWRESAFFKGLLQIYLSWEQHMQTWIDDQEIDADDRRRVEFIIGQLIAALAPSNLPINPGGLKRAEKSNGQTAVAGIKNWIQDVVTNQSMPRQINNNAYTLGIDLAITPGEIVYRNQQLELIQYLPETEKVRRRPIVMIPPQINKYYVFDLKPRNSLLGYLVKQGFQVFVISWKNPGSEAAEWGLETYVKAILEAIEVMRAITRSRTVNIISACAGGFTAIAMLGYLAETKNRLVYSHSQLVTTICPRSDSILELLITEESLELARKNSFVAGTMNGKDLAHIFAWLRPNDLVWAYWVNNYIMGRQPPPLDVLYWDNDSTRLPAALHSDFIDMFMADVYRRPKQHKMFGQPIDYGKIRVKTYYLAGQKDYLMPWKSIYREAGMVNGEKRFALTTGGHVQSILRPPNLPHCEYFINEDFPGTADDWFDTATRCEGSWWQDWSDWLHLNSGAWKKAPGSAGSVDFKPIVSAPGNYVRERM
jgi:polyhydroxyalkanoate synthase